MERYDERVQNDIKAGVRTSRRSKEEYTFDDFLADIGSAAIRTPDADVLLEIDGGGERCIRAINRCDIPRAISVESDGIHALTRERCRSGKSAANGFDRLADNGARAHYLSAAQAGTGCTGRCRAGAEMA